MSGHRLVMEWTHISDGVDRLVMNLTQSSDEWAQTSDGVTQISDGVDID